MMRLGSDSVVRVALLCMAAAVGWWARGAGTPVLAQHSSSSSSARESGADASLAFQFVGIGAQQSLAVFNPANRTLYVYPRVGEGSSHISCEYSYTILKPGAPMDRQNCPVGDQVPQR